MNTEPIPPFRSDAPSERLAELLQAAAAPASPADMRGEAAALAAFRAARREVHDPRSVPFMNRVARVLTVKAAALTIAVTGMGGVALAAGTGALPVPSDTPIVGSEAKAAKKAKAEKAAKETKVRDWSGLCTAATEGNALKNPGKAADSTAFARLITAAGGPEQVSAFCLGILGTTPVAPVESPVTAAEEDGENGKATAPGQLKEDGRPAAGKGKATAPGQLKEDGQPAAGKGKATAPGQVKKAAGDDTDADDTDAKIGKGHAKVEQPHKNGAKHGDVSPSSAPAV